MADIKAKFYQWGVNDIPPDWVTAAIADRTIVTDGDDDSFVVSDAGGRMRINPGDYLMNSMTVIFVVEERVYDAMMDMAAIAEMKRPRSPTAVDEPAVDDGAAEFAPPFSASVLARSARAREMQAAYENAHVEGADVPDEPDLVSPDPPKSA